MDESEKNANSDNSRFFTQKEGDNVKPTRCSHCGGKFKTVEKGWQCEDCLCLVDGVSFYQGRNSKEKELRNSSGNEMCDRKNEMRDSTLVSPQRETRSIDGKRYDSQREGRHQSGYPAVCESQSSHQKKAKSKCDSCKERGNCGLEDYVKKKMETKSH